MDALSTTLGERGYIDILRTPVSLVAFMLDPARDSIWTQQNSIYAKGLLNRVQYWVETGDLELSKAIEIRR
ncbi:MAG: hypothetical protein KDK62_08185, partial [Chlamydiia bacterium]|nr:hypothetical protein [Chlamydiia bacterium]